MAEDVGLSYGIGVNNISVIYCVPNIRSLCDTIWSAVRTLDFTKETRTQWRCYVKRLLLLFIVVGLLYPTILMAQGGPRIVEGTTTVARLSIAPGFDVVTSVESSRSILIGGTVGYTYDDGGSVAADLITGFSQPVSPRLYFTGMGKINKNSKYGVEIRSNYFLRPPTSGINFFLVSGVGVDWREDALMTGTVGFGAMKPGEYTSPWATFYVEQIAGIKELGITFGVLVMP